ncbi:MFS transporter [Flintibacter porci]|uniref:MFS transporter n=1 Tax=Flintibacter porci TaxID=3342383 RepID=UPI003F8A7777
MTEKRYLNWYNKVGYGSGDIADNVVYAFLTFFVMIYLSDTIGLNTGIVGTLMAVAKIFDGISDIIFGSLIDKTHTKMGKARPWMLWPYLGCGVCLFAIFSIPTSWGQTAQYAFFFIFYVMLNAGFYTANNIAYSALTALITKNENERVQIGSLRFVFAFTTSTIIQAVTFGLVEHFGNDAAAWRIVALIYVVLGIISNTISVLSVKELPEDENESKKAVDTPEEKYTLREAVGLLIKNKFYLLILGVYLLTQLYTAFTGVGTYYMTYVLGNKDLMGYFATALNVPMIVGLLLVPTIVAKLGGMYKINYSGYALATVGRILVIVAAYLGSVPMMLAFTAVASLGMCPLQGDLNAVIASASDYTYLTTGKRIDGTMYSCTSLGVKIGGGLGTAISGWLLAASGFIEGGVATQPESVLTMLNVMYLWLPMIFCALVTFLLTKLNVEKANAKLLEAKN